MSIENEEEVVVEAEEVEEEAQAEPEAEAETEPEEETVVEKPKESLEDRRARLKRQLEQTERKLGIKPDKKPEQKSSQESGEYKLSNKDLIAITNSKVHEDDLDEVIEIASLKKISVAEALKLDLTKTILSNKAEYRKSAQVSNTGPARKSASKISDEALLEKASKGEAPEKGSEEAERLFWLRRGGKR